MNRKKFMQAINYTSMINLTFKNKEDEITTIQCVPLDIKAPNQLSPSKTHYDIIALDDVSSESMTVCDSDICNIQVLEESFDPSDFVATKKQWLYPRDWGIYS